MPLLIDKIREQIARQLNDHADSPRGVVQDTYYTWTEAHIDSALETTLSYLYAYKVDLFGTIQCHEVSRESCLVDLKATCGNVIRLLGINSSCDNIIEKEPEKIDLLNLVSRFCNFSLQDNLDLNRYEMQHISEGIYQFSTLLPVGTQVHYLCAVYKDIYNLPDIILQEFRVLFVSMTCWLLLLTDNESRSNMDRVPFYYKQTSDFINLKLQLDFSTWASDYQDGKQLTPQTLLDK